ADLLMTDPEIDCGFGEIRSELERMTIGIGRKAEVALVLPDQARGEPRITAARSKSNGALDCRCGALFIAFAAKTKAELKDRISIVRLHGSRFPVGVNCLRGSAEDFQQAPAA